MHQLASRMAIGSFQAWDVALRVFVELMQTGLVRDRIFFLALLSIFLTRSEDGIPVPDFVELPTSELGDPVSCSAGPVAAKLAARTNGGGATLEQSLGCCLLPRQAERIASYVRQRKIVMGILFSKGEDERRACLTLLASSATPVEIHDLAGKS